MAGAVGALSAVAIFAGPAAAQKYVAKLDEQWAKLARIVEVADEVWRRGARACRDRDYSLACPFCMIGSPTPSRWFEKQSNLLGGKQCHD